MLKVNHLRLDYGKRNIVPDLSIQGLTRGTLTSLLGPNGSGKSTLLKALAGLLRTTSGRITLDDQDLTRASFEQRAKHVVYLPQSLPESVHLRVFESVLVAANASMYGAQTDGTELETIYALLRRLGIEHLAMHFLDQLSGGQKQLVGLAQALIRKPRLLLLDEPLSALDLNYQHGLITVIVLHDLNIALRHSDYALMIRAGRLLAEDAPGEVITAQTLADCYGVNGRIESCSRGIAQVLIDGLRDPIR
jgi:iron complex transport system ATP-binding protein